MPGGGGHSLNFLGWQRVRNFEKRKNSIKKHTYFLKKHHLGQTVPIFMALELAENIKVFTGICCRSMKVELNSTRSTTSLSPYRNQLQQGQN